MFTCQSYNYIKNLIGTIVQRGGIDVVSDYYKKLGSVCYVEFASMLVFDALIYNEDRHYGNFGLLRDNHTGRYTGCAPVFDNGYSLFATAMECDLADIRKHAKTRGIASCGVSHDDIVRNFCGETQRKQLKKMIKFRFAHHSQYRLMESRINKIESFLNERVVNLLSMEHVRDKSM